MLEEVMKCSHKRTSMRNQTASDNVFAYVFEDIQEAPMMTHGDRLFSRFGWIKILREYGRNS